MFKRIEFTELIHRFCWSQQKAQQRVISGREFANDAGVSSATFNRIYNGKTPDLETFLKLCAWMQVDPSEFINKPNTKP